MILIITNATILHCTKDTSVIDDEWVYVEKNLIKAVEENVIKAVVTG